MNSIVTQRFIKCHNKLKELKRVRSSRQFALSLDYLPQSLSEILKGRRDVTIELLRRAILEYKLNPVYLYTGDGPLFMTEEVQEAFKVLTIVTDGVGEEQIVHVPVPAQAGYATQHTVPGFIDELPVFSLPDYKYKQGTHRSFDVAGDSMEPTLFEGDKVICSFLDPTLWESGIKDNYVYVVVTKSDVMVKRLTNRLLLEKQLILTSDNEFYRPSTLGLNELQEIWYVRAKISPFLPTPQNRQSFLREELTGLRKTIAEQAQQINKLLQLMQREGENV